MVLSPADSTQMVYDRVMGSAASASSGGLQKLTFQAMNTRCQVQFRTANPSLARDFQAEVLRWVAWFEARYSRFIPDSLISAHQCGGRTRLGGGGPGDRCPFQSLPGNGVFHARRLRPDRLAAAAALELEGQPAGYARRGQRLLPPGNWWAGKKCSGGRAGFFCRARA